MFEQKELERMPNSCPTSAGTGVPRKMTREIWLDECFPEWHSILNKEIESAEFPAGSFGLWMLGGPSWAFKSAGGATFLVDNYSGSSLTSEYHYCGVCRTTGAKTLRWMRINPHVIDPWKFTDLDVVFATHHHQDHADFYTVAATLDTTNCKYVGPKNTCVLFRKWGVPENRILEVKPGDKFNVKDVEVIVEKNYDTMACMTGDYEPGQPCDFDVNAVSFIMRVDGKNSVIFTGDTLYNDGYKKMGEQYDIDILITDMGHNAPGGSDKMNPWEVMRLAQDLNVKIVIPDHYENWGSSELDPHQLTKIVADNDPNLKVCIMKSGGLFEYPKDKDMKEYKYPDWRETYNWEKSFVYGYGKPEKK